MPGFLKRKMTKGKTSPYEDKGWFEIGADIWLYRREDRRGYAGCDMNFSSDYAKPVDSSPPTAVIGTRASELTTIITDRSGLWIGHAPFSFPELPFILNWKVVFQEPQNPSRRWVGLIGLKHPKPGMLWGYIRFDLLDPAITGSDPAKFGQTFLIQIEGEETIRFKPVVVSSLDEIDLNEFERLGFAQCERVINAPGAVVRTTAIGGLMKKKVIDNVVIFAVKIHPDKTHPAGHGAP